MLMGLRYEQLTIRSASIREELHTEIERILMDVIHFKIHIQKKLEDYELFVEEEANREVTSDSPTNGAVTGEEATLGAEEDVEMRNVD